ncbi:MAG TPA: histidine kinase dimerization/phospho-acceptor domain-containing protein, partial [Myxococcota bacterium]|nr:histidine kinase dimerization/phospho-acceptor domain-containing protein [Myxococcota bacterium]
MTRAFVVSTLAILCAFVAALALNIWITWDHVIPDRPGAARFLAPGLKFTLDWLESGLAEVPDRDPEALGRVLGVPVRSLSEAEAEAMAAGPHVSVPLGAERFELYVDEGESGQDADERQRGVLHTSARGPLLIGALEGLSPFNARTVPLWIGLSLLVGAVASLVILRPLFLRLKRIEDTARRLSAGELEARAPLSGPTHMLALALNTMAERTGRVLRSHEELLQAVAHELRTPTARIRFGVELMASVDSRAERFARADALDRDLTELDALVNELLSFTRLGVESRAPREVVDAVALVREVVDEVAPSQEVVVSVDGASGAEGTVEVELEVEVEVSAMRRALRNLVMNAARHARRR